MHFPKIRSTAHAVGMGLRLAAAKLAHHRRGRRGRPGKIELDLHGIADIARADRTDGKAAHHGIGVAGLPQHIAQPAGIQICYGIEQARRA